MLTQHEKRQILTHEFNQINTNHDDFISREELYNYLDKKCKFQFDRGVADQLYERMDKDYDGRVTLSEFVTVYLEAEEILTNKIENTRAGIQEYYQKRQEAQIKLEEAVRSERLNSYGIMEGSTLNLTIVQAQNLQRDEISYNNTNTYVICSCGVQKFQTNVSNLLNPVWNENFVIGINTGNEVIQLMIMDFDQDSRDDCLGIVTVNLDLLKDQCKHEEWFEVFSNNGIRSNGKILLNMQWIYSYVGFYNEIIKAFEENSKALHEDLLCYETDLASLYEPFGSLLALQNNNQSGLRQSQGNENLKKSGITFNFQQMNFNGNYDKILLICFAFYLLFAIMILWNRACFLDVLIVTAFFVSIYLGQLTELNYAHIAFALVFSEIIDLSWLIIYTDGYWNGSSNFLADIPTTESLNRFIIMMSYFAFFLKIGIIIWLFYKKFLDAKTIIKIFS